MKREKDGVGWGGGMGGAKMVQLRRSFGDGELSEDRDGGWGVGKDSTTKT